MATESEAGKGWSDVAAIYRKMDDESDAKGATRVTAQEILAGIDATLPLNEASFIVDIGCGPGQLIGSILDSPTHAAQLPDNAHFVASDISSVFVDMTSARKQKRLADGRDIWKRLQVHQWDAENLSAVQDGTVSHIVSSYAYQAMRDQEKALQEAVRVLRPGGAFVLACIGPTQWGHIWNIIQDVCPQNNPLTAGSGQMDWRHAEGVRRKLTNAGFRDVGAKEYEVTTPFDTFDEAVEWCSSAFPHVRPIFASMSEDDAKTVKARMLQFIKDSVGSEPFRLKGTAVVGWGKK